MAASVSKPNKEPPIVEQVITEFFAKSVHIILESRSPYVSSRSFTLDRFSPSSSSPSPSSSPSGSSPRDKWFNLALRECPAALENCDLWRESYLEPLVIDIILMQRSSFQCKECSKGGKVIERWTIQYESQKVSSIAKSVGTSGSLSRLNKRTYNGLIILFRSLYLVVRLLPAYGVFCDLNSSGRIHPLSLSHRISSSVEPFTQAEVAEMKHFDFVPTETTFGRLRLSVSYSPSLELISSEAAIPIPAEVIPDYVGSPATERLKRFHSLPSDEFSHPCIFMTRRNSGSSEKGTVPLVSQSSCPLYSEPCVFRCSHDLELPPGSVAGDHWHLSEKASLKEQCQSPLSSPCTPINLVSGTESPSVSIPIPVTEGVRGKLESRSAKSKLVPSQSSKPRTQAVTASLNNPLSLKNRELVRYGEFQSGKPQQQVLYLGNDNVGPFPGFKYTARSPNMFAPLDEFDDLKFVFAEDDGDFLNTCRRIEHMEDKDQEGSSQGDGGALVVRRSPAAVAGALIHMLKVAPPLRDPQFENKMTVADALQELRTHRAARDSVLNQGNKP